MTTSNLPRKKTSMKRRSLHEEISDHLRSMIIEGELPEGERIDESALCEQLEISRTPLREALKVLHSEGLVSIEPNRGARVAVLTPEEFAELFELIGGLERMAAELAASRATDSELKKLAQMQTRLESLYSAGDRHNYFELNQDIHRMIIAMSRNSTLTSLHEQLLMRASRGRYMAIGTEDRWEESVQEHQTLLDALEAKDSVKAGEIMLEHVRHTGDCAVNALKLGKAV